MVILGNFELINYTIQYEVFRQFLHKDSKLLDFDRIKETDFGRKQVS